MVAAQGDFSFIKEMTLCASDSRGEHSVLSPCDVCVDGIQKLFTLQTCKNSTQRSLRNQH